MSKEQTPTESIYARLADDVVELGYEISDEDVPAILRRLNEMTTDVRKLLERETTVSDDTPLGVVRR